MTDTPRLEDASLASPMDVAPRLAAAIPRVFPGAPFRVTTQRDSLELTMQSASGPMRVYVPVSLDPGPEASRHAQHVMESRLAELAMLARAR